MKGFRLLKHGGWSKPPVLTAARVLLLKVLGSRYPLCNLGTTASFLNGTSYDVAEVDDQGRSPLIRISNMSDPAAPYLRTSENLGDRFWIRKGDLLVSWSASFKSCLWNGPEGYLNQHIFKVTEAPGFSRSYIRHAIEAVFDELQEKVVGIGMMHLRRADFLTHLIPSPPIQVQRSVAGYLDWVEGGSAGPAPTLPEGMEVQQRVIDKVATLTSLVQEARGLRERALAETQVLASRVTASVFPVGRDSTVGDYISFQTGYAFKSSWFIETGIRLVRNVNVGHGSLDWTDKVCIAPARREEFRRFELREGDILISLDRPIISTGVKVARVRGDDLPSLLLQRVARAVPKSDSVVPAYFYEWLRSPLFVGAVNPGRSNGVPHISHKDIEAIPFSLPSRSEQHRVVKELETRLDEIQRVSRVQDDTVPELDALLPAILDRAFGGEL